MTPSSAPRLLRVTGQGTAFAGLDGPSAPLELMSSRVLSVEELISLAPESTSAPGWSPPAEELLSSSRTGTLTRHRARPWKLDSLAISG